MSRFILLLLVLVPVAYLLLSSGADSEPIPGSYVNENKGFAIKFPSGWNTEIDTEEGLWTISAYDTTVRDYMTFYNVVRVTIEELPYKVKSDFFYNLLLEKAGSEYRGFTLLESLELETNGRNAYGNVVTYEVDGTEVKCCWLAVTNETYGYLVTCMSLPRDFAGLKSLFEESVQSFRLI